MESMRVAPLRIDGSGRYFRDGDGRPFFWMGDTLWRLFRSFSLDDVREILADRKRKGFSVLQVMFIGYEGEPQPNINGDLPWIGNDPAKPNEPYWQHVDAAMRVASEMGFVLVCGVYHKTHARFYTPGDEERSAEWIARRYRDVPQIVWSMYPEARREYTPIVRGIARGLERGDGSSHLITVHPDPSPQSSSYLHDEAWLTFNSLQTYNEIEQVYPMTAADYGRGPAKPAVMAEGGYEGATDVRGIDALNIRRQAYWTYLAGGHFVYGHDDNWRRPEKWREWIDSAGSRDLAVYRRIVTSLDRWWEIVPNQSIIAKGVGSGMELNAAGHSREMDWALVYFSGRWAAKVRMDRVKSAEMVEATWIDPRSGVRSSAGRFAWRDVPEFTPPAGWEDGLLLLQGASA